MELKIGNDWDEKLKVIWDSEGFKKFYQLVEDEYQNKTIFPPKDHIFVVSLCRIL